MGNRYLPDWLYNALPYFYACAGVLTMIVLRGEFALLSGLTLISAGVIVWLLRRRSRVNMNAERAAESAGEGGLIEMSWRQSYECGLPVIDSQHRRLFGLSNELIDAVLTKKPKYDVELLLHELSDHIINHFATEEALLAELGSPISKQHHEAHRTLLAKAGSLRDRYRRGEIIINDLIGFITYDVVANHVLDEAKSFGSIPAGNPPEGAADVAQRLEKESTDTVLKMFRDNPGAGGHAHLNVAQLDKLTPNKALFNAYPYIWQRICVFAPEPGHLERYLVSLSVEDRPEKRVGFSEQALAEMAAIRAENQRFLQPPPAGSSTDVGNP